MSRAVERCPFSVRPCAFLNVVRFIPSSLAVRFMRRAKAASDPSIASPNAVAASFADFTAAARIKYRSLMRWPERKPSFDGGSAAAFLEIRTLVSKEISPFSTASNTTYKVIIFVSDAG